MAEVILSCVVAFLVGSIGLGAIYTAVRADCEPSSRFFLMIFGVLDIIMCGVNVIQAISTYRGL